MAVQRSEKEGLRTIKHPYSPVLSIQLSDLRLALRDLAQARARKPTIPEVLVLLTAIIPALTAQFPDVFGFSGQLIKGVYFGFVALVVLLSLAQWGYFVWQCCYRKHARFETDPDKKVEQLSNTPV